MKHINLDKIVLDELGNNKPIILTIILSFICYILVQLSFPKKCAEFMDALPNINIKLIFFTLLPFIAAQLIWYFIDRIYAKHIHEFDTNMINKTMEELLESIKTNPKTNIDKQILLSNLFKLIEIKEIINLISGYVLPTILITGGLFIYFIFVDKTLAYTTLIISVISLIILFYMGKQSLNKSIIRDDKYNDYKSEINDIMQNLDSVLTNDTIKFEVKRLYNIRNKIKEYHVDSEMYNANIKGYVGLISIIILFVLGGILLKYLLAGKISRGETVAYLYIVLSLIQYYDSLSFQVGTIFYHYGNFKQASKYFEDFTFNDNNKTSLDITDGKIEFKNIDVAIKNKQIYKDLSHIIEPNSITGIVGEIGSGKSTMLKILLGYYDYDGNILIDGKDIKNYSKHEIRKHLSYIPQSPIFFNRTILENLKYGTNLSDEQVFKIIEDYNLIDFINKFPEKINTKIINNGENLSGGQKQILYLLKTIILNKKILLLDEPTASLDDTHTEMLINIINKLKNKTIMIVTHDEKLNKIFDKTIEIKKL
jgi:ABC-type multidrug transport system fused ATPase/permease subunit